MKKIEPAQCIYLLKSAVKGFSSNKSESFESEAEPRLPFSLFLIFGNFEPRSSYKIVLIKKACNTNSYTYRLEFWSLF